MAIPLKELREGRTVIVERHIPLLGDSILIRLPSRNRIREIYPEGAGERTQAQNALLLAEALTDEAGERLTEAEAMQLLDDIEGENPQAVMGQIYEAITGALQGEGSEQGKP